MTCTRLEANTCTCYKIIIIIIIILLLLLLLLAKNVQFGLKASEDNVTHTLKYEQTSKTKHPYCSTWITHSSIIQLVRNERQLPQSDLEVQHSIGTMSIKSVKKWTF